MGKKLSSKPISPLQLSVLKKGFNFAPTLNKLPTLDIICGVKKGLQQIIDAAATTTARSKIAVVLQKKKNDFPYITSRKKEKNRTGQILLATSQ